MSKEAYYFSHDSNARQDENILALRMKHGWEGYGIYWALIEKLRDSKDFTCLANYDVIAFDFRVEPDKVKSIIEDFGLFQFTENSERFFSASLNKRMDKRLEKSEKAKKAALKRWGNSSENHDVNANAMQTHSKTNADAKQGKERKGKEIKEKEIIKKESKKTSRFTPPKIQEVFNYMLEKKIERKVALKESKKLWNYYDAKGWMIGKNKMKNWKSAVSGWITRMNEYKPIQNGNSKNTERTVNRQTAETIYENSQGWEID